MTPTSYEQEIERIVREDPRYRAAAYHFVAESVAYTARRRGGQSEPRDKPRHIRGKELLEGIREFAIDQYGPLALDVLEDWGLRRTEDIGNVVFHLVEHNLLGASEDDSPDDFADGFDFRQAFLRPFAALPDATPDSDPPRIV